MPTMTWDSDADQKLLMAIISAHAIHIDFDAVAEKMGNVCTARAVQERLKKIKKAGAEAAGGAKPTPAAAKPKKGGPKAKANAKSEGHTDEGTQEVKAEDSEADTEHLTDIGSELDDGTEVKTETKPKEEAPAGKGKAGKAKAKAKAEPKAPKASGAGKSKITKADSSASPVKSNKAKADGSASPVKSNTAKADGNASPVKSNNGMKRKRQDTDEGAKGDNEN